VKQAKVAEMELLFGFNDCGKNEEIAPPVRNGHYIAYRLKEGGSSCLKTKTKQRRKRRSRVRSACKF